MKRSNVYERVRNIMINYPHTRSSDKELIWEYFIDLGVVQSEYYSGTASIKSFYPPRQYIYKEGFLHSPSFESITRARRKLQEQYPELGPTVTVKNRRKAKEKYKGNHVYYE